MSNDFLKISEFDVYLHPSDKIEDIPVVNNASKIFAMKSFLCLRK